MTEPLSTPTGVLEHVDPNLLNLELNVRTEASVTKQFVASIKENGVLVPIVAVRDVDGALWVRAGQRRTLAAREAGLVSVPVYVVDAAADKATRLVQQITENDQRLALGNVDRVTGIQALLDTGLTVTKVAKSLAVSPERVKQSKAVAGSSVAMEALHGKTATLAEAAAIAEFEDNPDDVARLLNAAQRNYFDQELQRLRDQRTLDAQRTVAAQAYEALGYTVLDAWPQYDSGQVPLHSLRNADGSEADESVITDANLWSVILSEEDVFTDKETGERVDDSTIDWSTEGNPDQPPRGGAVHHDTVNESTEWVVSNYFCHDPAAAGLTVAERFVKLAAASGALPDGVQPESADDLKRKAAEKAERRKVILLNKAADAAEVTRRKFVTTLLKRKTAPKGAMLFVASALLSNGMLLGSSRGDEAASALLGGEVRSGELLDHAADPRAEVVLLGLTLGALESYTGRSAWRGPGKESVAYLRFLQEQGYGLSPVEQVVTGDMSADACLKELSGE